MNNCRRDGPVSGAVFLGGLFRQRETAPLPTPFPSACTTRVDRPSLPGLRDETTHGHCWRGIPCWRWTPARGPLSTVLRSDRGPLIYLNGLRRATAQTLVVLTRED